MVNEYTGQLFSDCLGEKSGCHGGIYSAGKCKQYLAVPNLLSDLLYRILYERVHAPGAGAAADTADEVVQHLASFHGMQYFGVELDRIEVFLSALCCRYRAVCSVCNDLKSGCDL